jgi:hypothetical protein
MLFLQGLTTNIPRTIIKKIFHFLEMSSMGSKFLETYVVWYRNFWKVSSKESLMDMYLLSGLGLGGRVHNW